MSLTPRVSAFRRLPRAAVCILGMAQLASSEGAQIACPEYPELALQWQQGRSDALAADALYSSDQRMVGQRAYPACFWESIRKHGIKEKEQWERLPNTAGREKCEEDLTCLALMRCNNTTWRLRADVARTGCNKWNEARGLLKEFPAAAKLGPEEFRSQKAGLSSKLKEAREKRKGLDRYFPKDGRVLGVLDQQLNDAASTLEQAQITAQKGNIEKVKTGSLGGVNAIEQARDKSLTEQQAAQDLLFEKKGRRTSDIQSGIKREVKKGDVQLPDAGALAGVGGVTRNETKSGRGALDDSEARERIEKSLAAKPKGSEDQGGMSTVKKVGLGVAAVGLGALGLLLGGATSEAHAGELPGPEDIRRRAAQRFAQAEPSEIHQQRLREGLRGLGSEQARTQCLQRIGNLNDTELKRFKNILETDPGCPVDMALDRAVGLRSYG